MKRLDLPLPYGFAFNEAAHSYTLNDRVLPGVTGTIKAAGRMGSAVNFYNEFARERGTAVHQMLKLAQDNDLDESTIDERLKPYLTAWKTFQRVTKYRPMVTEQAVYCPEPEFAGTLDSAGILNGQLVVIDVKTQNYPSWARVQLTAYMMAVKAAGFTPAAGIGLCLKGDGTFKAHPYEFNEQNRAEWCAMLQGVAA